MAIASSISRCVGHADDAACWWIRLSNAVVPCFKRFGPSWVASVCCGSASGRCSLMTPLESMRVARSPFYGLKNPLLSLRRFLVISHDHLTCQLATSTIAIVTGCVRPDHKKMLQLGIVSRLVRYDLDRIRPPWDVNPQNRSLKMERGVTRSVAELLVFDQGCRINSTSSLPLNLLLESLDKRVLTCETSQAGMKHRVSFPLTFPGNASNLLFIS